MGRSNGTAVPLHVQVFTHPKTLSAAAVLVAEGMAARSEAPLAVVAALARLSGWAIADGDTGRVGHLSDARLAMEAWPEAVEDGRATAAAIGAALRRALHAVPDGYEVGLLEGTGADERVHDFEDHWANVLENRRIARTRRRSGPEPKAAPPAPATEPKPKAPAKRLRLAGNERGNDRTHDRTHGRTNDREYPASATASATESAAPPTPPAAAAGDPLVPLASEVRSRLRWRGTDQPVLQALEDLRAAGVPPDAVRAALREPWAVGLRPFAWRDRVLDARRGAPGQPALPPGAAPCTRCAGTGRVDAPNSPQGSMRCPRCDGRRVERAPAPPADPPERGFAPTAKAVGISAPRARGGVRVAPPGASRLP